MKRILIALLAAVLLASPANSSSHRPKAFDSVRALAWTSQVVSENFNTGEVSAQDVFSNHCTVTSINEKKHYWLTAAHCIANEEMTEVVPRDYAIGNVDQGYFSADVVKYDMDKDLAILEVPVIKVHALKLSEDMVTYGDKIHVVGHPWGWTEATLFVGTVAHPGFKFDPDDKAYMLYEMAVAPGNSGSAVLNSHDEIVSVVQIGWGGGFTSVSGGAPQDVLIKFAAPYAE